MNSLTTEKRASLFAQIGNHTGSFDEAMRNVEGITDPHDRTHFVRGFLESDQTEMETTALRLDDILSFLDPSQQPKLDSALQSFVARLTQFDPVFASNWVGSLNPPVVENARDQIAEIWVEADPPSASEWMSTVESSEFSDATISVLVRNIVNDPIGKISWTESISDHNLRYKLQRSALERSYLRNPEQFDQILSHISDPAARERLKVDVTAP